MAFTPRLNIPKGEIRLEQFDASTTFHDMTITNSSSTGEVVATPDGYRLTEMWATAQTGELNASRWLYDNEYWPLDWHGNFEDD